MQVMSDWSNVAYVDTETLGLNPVQHPIWETAIIIDNVEHCWQTIVSPTDIDRADPVALTINRFHDRYNRDLALTAVESAVKVESLLAGRHIVGAVPSFDEQRLRRLCDYALRHGLPPEGCRYPWHYHLIDVEALMLGFLCGQGRKIVLPWKSHDLSLACGVENLLADEHTALGDARWVRHVYERITS